MGEIVSRQYPHASGICRVEISDIGAPILVCSGCGTDEPLLNVAEALVRMRAHVGDGAEPLPD